MNYMKIYPMTVSDGPGIRVSLYVSGCKNHCPGCHNKASWDFAAGDLYTDETKEFILNKLSSEYMAGLTILGGEPMEFENQPEILQLVKQVKELYPKKSIWIFSGYEYADVTPGGKRFNEITRELLKYVDVMVLGRFDITKRDISSSNRWRGSTNQRVIDMKKSLAAGYKIPVEGIPNNEI